MRIIHRPISISVHFLFWILAALIGSMASTTLSGILVWVGIIFASVLIHELGHAFTAMAFRQTAEIQLVVFGGLTSYQGPPLKSWQQFLIVLNGPLASLLLSLIATILLSFSLLQESLQLQLVLRQIQWANIFWSLLNLLPILPLDGGQLLRIVLEAAFGVRGLRASLFIGALLAVLLGALFFLGQNILGGALFLLFAYQSFDAWRKFRYAVKNDTEEAYKTLMTHAEEALLQGDLSKAKELFTQIRASREEGVLYVAASENLAYLAFQAGEMQQVFDLLAPLQVKLQDEARFFLHRAAATLGQDAVVAELSTLAYQRQESSEVALDNAKAFARLHQGKLAGGWLQTAMQGGETDVSCFLAQEPFLSLHNDPEFCHFFPDKV